MLRRQPRLAVAMTVLALLGALLVLLPSCDSVLPLTEDDNESDSANGGEDDNGSDPANGEEAEPGTIRFSLDGKLYTLEDAMAGYNEDGETAITTEDGTVSVTIEFRGLTSGTYHAGSEDGALMEFVDSSAPDNLPDAVLELELSSRADSSHNVPPRLDSATTGE